MAQVKHSYSKKATPARSPVIVMEPASVTMAWSATLQMAVVPAHALDSNGMLARIKCVI